MGLTRREFIKSLGVMGVVLTIPHAKYLLSNDPKVSLTKSPRVQILDYRDTQGVYVIRNMGTTPVYVGAKDDGPMGGIKLNKYEILSLEIGSEINPYVFMD